VDKACISAQVTKCSTRTTRQFFNTKGVRQFRNSRSRSFRSGNQFYLTTDGTGPRLSLPTRGLAFSPTGGFLISSYTNLISSKLLLCEYKSRRGQRRRHRDPSAGSVRNRNAKLQIQWFYVEGRKLRPQHESTTNTASYPQAISEVTRRPQLLIACILAMAVLGAL